MNLEFRYLGCYFPNRLFVLSPSFSFYHRLPHHRAAVMFVGGLPFQACLAGFEGQQKFPGRQIGRGLGMNRLVVCAGRECAPLAGGQHFDFAVHNLHRHRTFVMRAGQSSFRGDGIAEGQHGNREQGDGRQQFSHERAAFTEGF